MHPASVEHGTAASDSVAGPRAWRSAPAAGRRVGLRSVFPGRPSGPTASCSSWSRPTSRVGCISPDCWTGWRRPTRRSMCSQKDSRRAPDQTEFLVLRGSILGRLQRYREADADLRRVLRLHPSHAPAQFELGLLLGGADWCRRLQCPFIGHSSSNLTTPSRYYYLGGFAESAGRPRGSAGRGGAGPSGLSRRGQSLSSHGPGARPAVPAGPGPGDVPPRARACRPVIQVSRRRSGPDRGGRGSSGQPTRPSIRPLPIPSPGWIEQAGPRFAEQRRLSSPLESRGSSSDRGRRPDGPLRAPRRHPGSRCRRGP